MRRRFAPLAALFLALSALAAACGGGSSNDPYELAFSSTKADWDPVQVNVGFAVEDGSTSFTIAPDAIGVVIDEEAGAGGMHVSIPAEDLDLDPAMLDELGITGDSIDLDVVWDGEALYARSPTLGMVVEVLLAQSGDVPPGDLTGWLQLGAMNDLESLMELIGEMGTMPVPSAAPPADAKAFKASLEDIGVTLTNAGSEQRDGKDAHHITVALDQEKLLESEAFKSMPADQAQQFRQAIDEMTIDIDLWIEKSSNRLVEMSMKMTSTENADQTIAVVVQVSDPDGSIATDAPSDFVELPMDALITNVMELIGEGLPGF